MNFLGQCLLVVCWYFIFFCIFGLVVVMSFLVRIVVV